MTVQLVVDGYPLTLILGFQYYYMCGYWTMSISDVNNVSLVASVPLITGVYPAANLLAQYGYLKIGSAYLLNTGSDLDYPDSQSLDKFMLLWGDTA